MRLPVLFLALSLPALADSGGRLAELLEKGPPARRELLDEVRREKDTGGKNGAVPLVEALISLADGRILEASEYAKQAADAPLIDFGDRERALADVEAERRPEPAVLRSRAIRELCEILVAWGEESEWRGKLDRAKTAYATAAGLGRRLENRAVTLDDALFFANLRYRALHRQAGLALRAGHDPAFRAAAASATEAHAARTALAAAPEPATKEDWKRLVETGPDDFVRERPEQPDHAVKALLEAPSIFCGKTPAALLLAGLNDRFGDRTLPLRWDSALALLPHAKAVAPSIRKWLSASDAPSVGNALLARAGEPVEIAEDQLDDPWAVRACSDENALERAFERLPKAKRVAVAFRLNDLRGEDEVDLGR